MSKLVRGLPVYVNCFMWNLFRILCVWSCSAAASRIISLWFLSFLVPVVKSPKNAAGLAQPGGLFYPWSEENPLIHQRFAESIWKIFRINSCKNSSKGSEFLVFVFAVLTVFTSTPVAMQLHLFVTGFSIRSSQTTSLVLRMHSGAATQPRKRRND